MKASTLTLRFESLRKNTSVRRYERASLLRTRRIISFEKAQFFLKRRETGGEPGSVDDIADEFKDYLVLVPAGMRYSLDLVFI